MSQNISWRVRGYSVMPGESPEIDTREEPFGVVPVGDGAVVFTKEPFYDESTMKSSDTPRDSQNLSMPKPRVGQ